MPMEAPWKRNLVLLEWTEMVCVQARSFHPECGRYLRKAFKEAWSYFERKINPQEEVDKAFEDMDARLVALLMAAMPERVRTQIYRMKGSNYVLDVLCCMYATLNPGVKKSLLVLLRLPGTLVHAKRQLALEKRWRTGFRLDQGCRW